MEPMRWFFPTNYDFLHDSRTVPGKKSAGVVSFDTHIYKGRLRLPEGLAEVIFFSNVIFVPSKQ